MKEYYDNNYLDYYNKTVSVDSSLFLSEFAKRLKPGGKILDVGCGSGRDLSWFKKNGFRPVGLERSKGLAELARKNSGCEIIIADFKEFDFSGLRVDGILFSASLVHVPHNDIEIILSKALSALKSDGFLYISVKEGDKTKQDAVGRTFYLWRNTPLRSVFTNIGLRVVHFSDSESVLKNSDVWLGYVLKYI